MKKAILLLTVLALLCGLPFASGETLPVHTETPPPSAPIILPDAQGRIYTQWNLYGDQPEPLMQVSGVTESTGKDFVVTFTGLDAWGAAPEACTGWTFDHAQQLWVENADVAGDATPGSAVLRIDAYYYYMNGFPTWRCEGVGQVTSLRLEDYSSDPNNPDYRLTLAMGDSMICIPASGAGYMINTTTDDTVCYLVYDRGGVLNHAMYTHTHEDDLRANYVVAKDLDGSYFLFGIQTVNAKGEEALWMDGEWRDSYGETVEAPAGVNPDVLPFEIIQ